MQKKKYIVKKLNNIELRTETKYIADPWKISNHTKQQPEASTDGTTYRTTILELFISET
jgi:hypothetical protein